MDADKSKRVAAGPPTSDYSTPPAWGQAGFITAPAAAGYAGDQPSNSTWGAPAPAANPSEPAPATNAPAAAPYISNSTWQGPQQNQYQQGGYNQGGGYGANNGYGNQGATWDQGQGQGGYQQGAGGYNSNANAYQGGYSAQNQGGGYGNQGGGGAYNQQQQGGNQQWNGAQPVTSYNQQSYGGAVANTSSYAAGPDAEGGEGEAEVKCGCGNPCPLKTCQSGEEGRCITCSMPAAAASHECWCMSC